ncbi:unnamed protein product, partial [Vitis vinifera]
MSILLQKFELKFNKDFNSRKKSYNLIEILSKNGNFCAYSWVLFQELVKSKKVTESPDLESHSFPAPDFTLDGFMSGSKPYLISGSDDHTAKVWDYQSKSCVQTLEDHT